MSSHQFLIFGSGWLGKQFSSYLQNAPVSTVDIAEENSVSKEIDRLKPKCIVNCVGKTGKPNIDSCEQDFWGTYRSNVVGAITLGALAKSKGIHFVHMSSGCLFEGDNGGKGFDETLPPNFLESVYSRTKAVAETALRDFDALQLRIRMPISGSPHPRNLLTKLIGYRQVIREPNSITVLEDFFPAAVHLMKKGQTGIFNMVNEGIEYHDDLLSLYQKIVDPKFRFEVISWEQLKTQLQTGRSNCILNTQKLRQAGAGMPDLKDSLPTILKAYSMNSQKGQP